LRPRHRRRPLKEVSDCFSLFQMIEKRLDRDARTRETRRTTHALGIHPHNFFKLCPPLRCHESNIRENAILDKPAPTRLRTPYFRLESVVLPVGSVQVEEFFCFFSVLSTRRIPIITDDIVSPEKPPALLVTLLKSRYARGRQILSP